MNKPQKIILDKDKILEQIQNLREIAKKEKWQYNYDTEIDELVFGKAYMPRDSFLYNISNELNLFVSPDSTVNGIFIEYFDANFLEHNKELKPVLAILEEESEKRPVEEDEKTVIHAKEALENELLADAFKSVFAKEHLVAAT